jgi:hypothetical protein
MNSPPEPNPPPIDAALAAYVERRIDERLASLLAAKHEFIERLIELKSVAARVEDAMHRLAAIQELGQRQTVIDMAQRQRRQSER